MYLYINIRNLNFKKSSDIVKSIKNMRLTFQKIFNFKSITHLIEDKFTLKKKKQEDLPQKDTIKIILK